MVLIGGTPSSGTTMLADIIDSSYFSACGPEVNIFSNKKLYTWDNFKKKPFSRSVALSFYRSFNKTHLKKLYSYGMNREDYLKLVENSEDTAAFCKGFEDKYLALRGKESDGVVFEKTPENVDVIQEFLDTDKGNYFVFVIRHPEYMIRSFRNRNISRFKSILTWYTLALMHIKYANNKRVIFVKYEDLVVRPFKIVSDILNKVQTRHSVTPEEVENAYKNNNYRKLFALKLGTWKNQDVGKVRNGNSGEVPKDVIEDLSALRNYRLKNSFSDYFNLPTTTLNDALQALGYELSGSDKLTKFKTPYSLGDFMFLFKKGIHAVIEKGKSFPVLLSFIYPLAKK